MIHITIIIGRRLGTPAQFNPKDFRMILERMHNFHILILLSCNVISSVRQIIEFNLKEGILFIYLFSSYLGPGDQVTLVSQFYILFNFSLHQKKILFLT